MSSRRLVVSYNDKALDAVNYRVVVNGKVVDVLTAYVVADGVIRQYYPSSTAEPPPPPPPEPPPGELGFTKYFIPSSAVEGSETWLYIDVDNRANESTVTGVAFIDDIPADVSVVTPIKHKNTMGGTLVIDDVGGSIELTDGVIGSGEIGTIKLMVTSVVIGDHINTTEVLTSSLGSHGTASGTLTVIADTGHEPLLWDTAPILVKKWAVHPVAASAAIMFYRDTGSYAYNNHPDANIAALYKNPPIAAAGKLSLIHI